jgi:hypothetical protein
VDPFFEWAMGMSMGGLRKAFTDSTLDMPELCRGRSNVLLASLEALQNSLGENDVSRWVYKATECGACFSTREDGVSLAGYVEGWDGECPSHFLPYPFTLQELYETLEVCDQEADEIWKETHGCDDCWKGEPYEGDFGRPVDPNCLTCKGEGTVI